MNENLKDGEHDYRFVGKAGLFCPIKPGKGGGELLRLAGEDKYASATGAKDYRWLESEVVKANSIEADINMQYYIRLADEARDAIAQYGDTTWFTSDDPVPPPDPDFMHVPEGAEDGVPFDED